MLYSISILILKELFYQQISAAHLLSSITPDEENKIFSELWGANPGI